MPAKKKGTRVLSGQFRDHPKRKQTGPNHTKGKAANLPGYSTKWRSIVTEEQKKGSAGGFDFSGAPKVWKEGYLKGLESYLKWQEESEYLVRDAVRQGFTGSQNWLTLYKNWAEMSLEQTQGQANGVPNPLLALARQSLQAFQASAEPVVKTAADTYEKTFANYESTVAGPFRKQVIEINKKVVEALVSA